MEGVQCFILFLAFVLIYLPVFGILTLADSKSPNFWVYAAIAFWVIEMIVILCLDLIFIRFLLGGRYWTRWQTFWKDKTHWGLAIANTLACTAIFGFLLLICFFSDNMSTHEIDQAGMFALPALVTFCVFAFYHSIFRDRPSLVRGGITYGSFTLLLVILGLWNWL